MAKGCVYIPKTGKDAGKVFGSKESLAAHMNYTPALTDLMSKFQQSGGKADIDSVTKWLTDNGYLKVEAAKPAAPQVEKVALAKKEKAPETKPEVKTEPVFNDDIKTNFKPSENLLFNQGGFDNLQSQIGVDPDIKTKYVQSKGVSTAAGRRKTLSNNLTDALRKIGRVFEGEKIDLRGMSEQAIIDYANTLDEIATKNERFGGKRATITKSSNFGRDVEEFDGRVIGYGSFGVRIITDGGAIIEGKKFSDYTPKTEQKLVSEVKEAPKGKPDRRERLAKLFEEPKVEVAPTKEAGVEAAPEMTPEEIRINMKPITDEMAGIEMEFANNGYSIDWDYDNEIIITDKNGEIVDAEELPGKLLPLAAQYEKATAGLAGYDFESYRKALEQSRKDVGGIETEFEEVKPLAITEKTETQQLTLKDGRKISPIKINGKTAFFHASSKKREGRLRANTAPQWGKAVYFAGSRKGATDEFGGDNVTEVNLDLKKPLYTNSKEFKDVDKKAAELYNKAMLPKIRQREAEFVNGEWKFFNEDFQSQYDKKGYVDFYSASDIEEGKYFGEAAQELGYDAIIDEGGQYGTEIAVLDESAIIYPEDVTEAAGASVESKPFEAVLWHEGYGEKTKGDAVYLESEEASKAASGKGKPYRVKLNNPYIVEKDGDFDLIKGFINEFTKNNPQSKWHPDTTKYVNDKLRGLGYDGLVIKQSAIDTDKGYEDIESTYGNAQVVAFNKNAVSPVEQVEAEKPKSKLDEKKALDQSVNELINKKNRYNKIAKKRKPLAGNLLNEIKEEADRLGFATSPALGGNIKLVSKKDGKAVSRRNVDRKFNKERNEKVKAAKAMANDFTFGLRGSILLYFLNGGKISTTSSELGRDSKELQAAKKAGIVSDTGTSASSIAKEDLREMGAAVFDELDTVAQIQDVVASFENKEQMEDELVDMLDKFNRDMEEAAEYDSMRKVNQGIEEGRIDEGEQVDYFELLPEDEKIKLIEEYERFKQEVDLGQLDQQGEGLPSDVAPSQQEEAARESKSKRLQKAEELRAKAQDLRDASGGMLMAGPKLLAAAYEAYATILETTENIIEAINKFKGTKEYKDLDAKGKKELDVVLATDAVEEEISSGRDPQEAVDDLIGSQEWYQSLSANQKEQLDEILKDDFGVTPVTKTGIKATIANIIDNYYKGDRQSKLDNKRILESDPKLKYIYDNISKINKQLQDAGVITDKTDGCP